MSQGIHNPQILRPSLSVVIPDAARLELFNHIEEGVLAAFMNDRDWWHERHWTMIGPLSKNHEVAIELDGKVWQDLRWLVSNNFIERRVDRQGDWFTLTHAYYREYIDENYLSPQGHGDCDYTCAYWARRGAIPDLEEMASPGALGELASLYVRSHHSVYRAEDDSPQTGDNPIVPGDEGLVFEFHQGDSGDEQQWLVTPEGLRTVSHYEGIRRSPPPRPEPTVTPANDATAQPQSAPARLNSPDYTAPW